jgi:hypothetical protein
VIIGDNMGTWDHYSFSNDAVMDCIGFSLDVRLPIVVTASEVPKDMNLEQIIKEYYGFSYSDPKDAQKEFRIAIKTWKELECDEMEYAGIVLLYSGNGYPPAKQYLKKAIQNLKNLLKNKANLSGWKSPTLRSQRIIDEIGLLTKLLRLK